MPPLRTLAGELRRTAPVPASRLRFVVVSCLATSVGFNFILCFVDSNLVELNQSHVVASELALISAALLLALSSWHPLMRSWLHFAAFVVIWWFMLGLFRSELDPKYARDIVVIPVFVMLGISASGDRRLAQNWLPFHLLILLFMVYEALYPSSFTSLFNVKQYYIHTRGFQASDFWNPDIELFVSATRPDERHLFSSLPFHRLSSVFLEPVSLENYVVVVAIFLVAFRRRLAPSIFWTFAITDVALLIGSDGRFGASLCVVLALVALFGRRLSPSAPIAALPVAIVGVLAMVAVFGFESGSDDFRGRIAYTAELLAALGTLDLMGLSSSLVKASADSGIVYLIVVYSILGVALGWAFVFGTFPSRAPTATILRCGAAVYLSGNLMVSASVFSLKTAALLWFIVGYADGLTWREQRGRAAFGRDHSSRHPDRGVHADR
jgi:putative polymerase